MRRIGCAPSDSATSSREVICDAHLDAGADALADLLLAKRLDAAEHADVALELLHHVVQALALDGLALEVGAALLQQAVLHGQRLVHAVLGGLHQHRDEGGQRRGLALQGPVDLRNRAQLLVY